MTRLPGGHVPNIKNRSSKHFIWLTKKVPVVKSMSGELLRELSKNGCRVAEKELTRRSKLIKKEK